MPRNCDGKVIYSKKQVHDAIRASQKRRNVKLRGYECRKCGGYHMTSNTKDI